jgi:methylmalonyl-CoA/ethylmalonyl-CoA epimerase
LDLKGLHHTGIVVRSLKEAYAVYRDQLGMKLLVEEYIEDQGVRAALLDTGNSLLELLEPVEPETGIARYLEKRGEGMHHICLEVDGIQRALDEIKSQGLQLIDETPRPGLTGTIAFLHPSASHGVLIELVDSAGAYRVQR